MAAVDAARAIPILPSPDLSATRDFYRDRLAFLVGVDLPDYLIVRRGQIELHFWRSDDRNLPKVTSCYIRGGEIAALHAEFSARGVEHLSDFTVRPWNMKEFHILDPHGNLLRFGCDPTEA